jgi:hypothetical protein
LPDREHALVVGFTHDRDSLAAFRIDLHMEGEIEVVGEIAGTVRVLADGLPAGPLVLLVGG